MIALLLAAALALRPDAKLLFPAQDDLAPTTGKGTPCDMPPNVLRPLEQYVARELRRNYIAYDLAALNRRGVSGIYYIYSRADCERLRRKYFPAANVFVMARVKVRECRAHDASYDVEVKVYSRARRSERVIFRRAAVPIAELAEVLQGHERELVGAITDFVRAR